MLTGLFTQLGLIQPYVKTGATSDVRPSRLTVSLLLAKPERTEKRNHQIAQTSRLVPKDKLQQKSSQCIRTRWLDPAG